MIYESKERFTDKVKFFRENCVLYLSYPMFGTLVPLFKTFVPDTGTRVLPFETRVPNTGTRVPLFKTFVPDTGTNVPNTGTSVLKSGTIKEIVKVSFRK